MRTVIRSLVDVPEGSPRRYSDGRGYVLLIWKVGRRRYKWCFEHRLVMGFPDGHVHHKNHDKSDNRPENLEALDERAHSREHHPRGFPIDRAIELYQSGLTLKAVALQLGALPTSVLRSFQRLGIQRRKRTSHNASKVRCLRGHAFTPENIAPAKGGRSCRLCAQQRNREYRRRLKVRASEQVA